MECERGTRCFYLFTGEFLTSVDFLASEEDTTRKIIGFNISEFQKITVIFVNKLNIIH